MYLEHRLHINHHRQNHRLWGQEPTLKGKEASRRPHAALKVTVSSSFLFSIFGLTSLFIDVTYFSLSQWYRCRWYQTHPCKVKAHVVFHIYTIRQVQASDHDVDKKENHNMFFVNIFYVSAFVQWSPFAWWSLHNCSHRAAWEQTPFFIHPLKEGNIQLCFYICICSGFRVFTQLKKYLNVFALD